VFGAVICDILIKFGGGIGNEDRCCGEGRGVGKLVKCSGDEKEGSGGKC